MQWLRKIWEFFNGNKTMIGGVCVWVGYSLIQGLLIGELQMTAEILPKLAAVFIWIGQYLAPLGVGHKVVKAIKNG